MSDGRARLRFALVALALLAAAWSLVLLVTRGVSLDLGPLHISSRNARNPAFGAVLVLVAAALLAPRRARARTVAADASALLGGVFRGAAILPRPIFLLLTALTRPRSLTGGAILLVALTLALSWTRGAFIIGGADSYGYVSEAHLFATGRLRPEVPLARAFPHVPFQAFAPLGYRPADDGTATLVPTYAPGLPLTMAVAEVIGGMDAVYVVMPLLAALAIWCTYAIGAQLVGPGTGFGAALLLFASPAFMFQMIGAPMSDVCAAGWWALAIALLLHDRRWSMAAAGAATGMAVLTRPNLLLVAVVLGAYLLARVVRDTNDRRERVIRLLTFSGPVVLGCLAVAGFNAAWYGSPFRSGYSASLFSVHYWSDNIRNFSQWLTESQTPLFFVGLAAPLVARWLPARPGMSRRGSTLLLAGMALAVCASYLFYMPFEAWWFLRFLVPAFPAFAGLTCLTLAALSARLGMPARVVSVAAVLLAAGVGLSMIKDLEAYGENRYRIIGEWIEQRLPQNAVVLALQHAGNINHYSGRTVIRYDMVPVGGYQAALDEMIAAGYHPYLVVDEWEIPGVQQLHGNEVRGTLDWPPVAVLPLGNVTVWDLREDVETARRSRREPQTIPVPEFIRRRMP